MRQRAIWWDIYFLKQQSDAKYRKHGALLKLIAVTVTRRRRLDQINEYNQLASVLASIQDEKIVIRRRLNIRIRSRSYKRLKKFKCG